MNTERDSSARGERQMSAKLAERIERDTGLSVERIKASSFEAIDGHLEQRIGRKLAFGKEPGHWGRGSVLLQEDRIIFPEEVRV